MEYITVQITGRFCCVVLGEHPCKTLDSMDGLVEPKVLDKRGSCSVKKTKVCFFVFSGCADLCSTTYSSSGR